MFKLFLIHTTAVELLKVNLNKELLVLFLLPSEEETVAFHEFAYQQEPVDGGDAVGDYAGNNLTFAGSRLRSGEVMPEGVYMTRLLLNSGFQFVLA